MFDRRPFTFDEIEIEPHGREGQQQIGEQDCGVDLDGIDRLQRDRDSQFRLRDYLEQAVTLPQRPVLRHVTSGLAHEPNRSAVDRLAAARA